MHLGIKAGASTLYLCELQIAPCKHCAILRSLLVWIAQVRVSKWLKELEMMFYGSSLAYDKVRVHS